MSKKRIIVGISGASGAAFGLAALKILAKNNVETDLIVTNAALRTLESETTCLPEELAKLCTRQHAIENISALPASGSYPSDGMIIAPCSIRSLSAIAVGLADNLLIRAADVTLKERRKLVLMVRETPLHAGHLRAMQQVTEAGGIIAPPVPPLYAKPQTVDELVTQTTARILDQFAISDSHAPRWQG